MLCIKRIVRWNLQNLYSEKGQQGMNTGALETNFPSWRKTIKVEMKVVLHWRLSVHPYILLWPMQCTDYSTIKTPLNLLHSQAKFCHHHWAKGSWEMISIALHCGLILPCVEPPSVTQRGNTNFVTSITKKLSCAVQSFTSYKLW